MLPPPPPSSLPSSLSRRFWFPGISQQQYCTDTQSTFFCCCRCCCLSNYFQSLLYPSTSLAVSAPNIPSQLSRVNSIVYGKITNTKFVRLMDKFFRCCSAQKYHTKISCLSNPKTFIKSHAKAIDWYCYLCVYFCLRFRCSPFLLQYNLQIYALKLAD